MNERIQVYVGELFRNAPKTKLIDEVREELIANLNEKYTDILSRGKTGEEAFDEAVSNIGDIEGLINDLSEAGDTNISGLKRKLSTENFNYIKEDDSFVEDFKEKVSSATRKYRLIGAASWLLWAVVVIAYFAVSFLWQAWATSWIVFIVGAVFQLAVISVLSDKSKKLLGTFLIYTVATVIYLAVSFYLKNQWDKTWLIFLAAVAVQQGIRFFRIYKESQ